MKEEDDNDNSDDEDEANDIVDDLGDNNATGTGRVKRLTKLRDEEGGNNDK